MIVDRLQSSFIPPCRPLLRVREEAAGGSLFETTSGKVSRVPEDGLAAWRARAAGDARVIYYAIRQWSTRPLASGCSSSPDRIYLEVTQRCNLACPFCYRNAGSAAVEEQSTDELLDLIRSLAILGVHELRFTGGEPTTHPDILELIDTAIAAGFFVTLGTNGVLSAFMTEALSGRRLGRFLVSLDGPLAIHDALRGAGTFRRTMATVRRLLAAGKKVRINTVLCRKNLAVLRDFVALCSVEGVENISLIVPRPLGRASGAAYVSDVPDAADMEAVARIIRPLSRETGVRLEFQYNRYAMLAAVPSDDPVIHKVLSCPAGTQAAFISPEGILYACGCAAEWLNDPLRRPKVAAGCLRRANPASIWSLWQVAPVWAAFRDLKASKASGCLVCTHYGSGCFGSCPVHAFAVSGRLNAPDPMCALSGQSTPEERL